MRQLLPVIYLCFFFESIKLQKQGEIRGLNLIKSAAYITVIAHLAVSIPLGLLLAFPFGKGVIGLRAGVLVGQVCLLSAYLFMIQCTTNWEDVWQEVHRRLKKD